MPMLARTMIDRDLCHSKTSCMSEHRNKPMELTIDLNFLGYLSSK
jgi:hypothetical protein